MELHTIPLRHEYKYYINRVELTALRHVLSNLLQPDPNGDEHNEYHIRSLYFDTLEDRALHEKINGEPSRDKYRIRIYKFSDKVIQLECKSKYDQLISKQSVRIPRLLAEQLMAGDPSGLEFMSHPMLQSVFRLMRTELLRPAVIVDYVREAYIHPAEDVRITFDKRLRTGLFSGDLFNMDLPTYPALDAELDILEVKYNRFLPSFLQQVLCGVSAERSAVSKYVICRRYENKEF